RIFADKQKKINPHDPPLRFENPRHLRSNFTTLLLTRFHASDEPDLPLFLEEVTLLILVENRGSFFMRF
ncbi:MAG: hypothetical protein EAZ80_09010, partial [Runella slithyformis]